MTNVSKPTLDPRKSYLQIALNSSLSEARKIIQSLPISDRIIVEAGTPLIKQYGEYGIRQIHDWYAQHLQGGMVVPASLNESMTMTELFSAVSTAFLTPKNSPTRVESTIRPYIVADLKTMDRAETEVTMAVRGGASAVTALGIAPVETLNTFIETCERYGVDAMIDMMNVEYPLAVLQKLKKIPPVIIIHRGVDEERFNKEKQIPLHEIRRIKGMYNVMISIAGGDTTREVQRAIFNDADIVVVWKSVYTSTDETVKLIENFLAEVK